MNVLVVNVGSSTVKVHLVGEDESVLAATELPVTADGDAIRAFAADAPPFDAIGHRVVHGGEHFTTATVVDDAMLPRLDELDDLAPLHNPPAVGLLRATLAWNDPRPNVVCFDTTFHATLREAARTYAVPTRWRDQFGLRRFGFHGLSHSYASRRAAELLGLTAGENRVVSCHLGAGASLAAVVDGCSVDTTMGFTPVEGLVMATRSGDVDPGALAWLVGRGVVAPDDLERELNHRSGLLALAGTSDMREILDRVDAGDGPAVLALEVYEHKVAKSIAAMTASMGGIDALVFTGGIGARSAEVRKRACSPLGFLGVAVDDDVNESTGDEDVDVSRPDATTRTVVIRPREELEIAREVEAVLRG